MNHLPLEKAIILNEELKKAGVEIVTEQLWELVDKTWDRPGYDQILAFHKGGLSLEKKLVMQAEKSESYEWWSRRPYKWTLSNTLLPAATASEMIYLLPKKIHMEDRDCVINITLYGIQWRVSYLDLLEKEYLSTFTHYDLLEAVYEALLWCLREGHITVKE